MRNVYEVTLPTPDIESDPGLESWVLNVALDGALQSSQTGLIDQLTTELSVPLLAGGGSPEVVLSLVYVDRANNASEVSTLSFSAPDTIAPEAPGAMSVTLLRTEE